MKFFTVYLSTTLFSYKHHFSDFFTVHKKYWHNYIHQNLSELTRIQLNITVKNREHSIVLRTVVSVSCKLQVIRLYNSV